MRTAALAIFGNSKHRMKKYRLRVLNQKASIESDLLLLTYEYPYGTKETFIETEIQYLSKEFNKIWILPERTVFSSAWLRKKNLGKRALPENCELINVEQKSVRYFLETLTLTFSCIKHICFDLKSTTSPFIQAYLATREALKASLLACELKIKFSNILPYSYSYWKASGAFALASLRSENRVPGFVTRAHGGDLYYDRAPYKVRPFDNFIAEQADSVLTISAHGARHLIAKGFNKEKVSVARLGVRRQATSRQSEDGIIRIVSCSNVIPLKRVDLIARSLLLLQTPFEWIHFGDGVDLRKVKELSSRASPIGRSIFPGRIPNKKILKHYTTSPVDLFVNVSNSEGVPVSIMEALAAGIPCIATDVGGTGEIVDNTCGELVPAEIDEQALAHLIESVAADKLVWAARRNGALIRGAELCDAEKNYTQFSKFLAAKVSRASVL